MLLTTMLFWWLGLAAIVEVIVTSIIDRFVIKQKVLEEYKQAAKAIIESTDIKEVKVGIYGTDNKKIKEMRIKSDEGVDSSIYKGQSISCYN